MACNLINVDCIIYTFFITFQWTGQRLPLFIMVQWTGQRLPNSNVIVLKINALKFLPYYS